MKIKTTKKQITNNYINIICVGYCDLSYLLKGQNASYYTCGVYGWNADIYHINNNTCIVTGYRPFGNIYPSYDCITQKYNEKARQIYYNNDYTIATKKINKLLNKFINDCL